MMCTLSIVSYFQKVQIIVRPFCVKGQSKAIAHATYKKILRTLVRKKGMKFQ